MQDKPTLCWKCANACGGCSWSNGSFTPVVGWKAKKTVISANHGGGFHADIESYIVKSCPQFRDDSEQFKIKNTSIQKAIVKVVKPLKQRPIIGSARWRLSKLPDLKDRINRLSGYGKDICDMVFNYNYTIEDAADAMYMDINTAKKHMYKAFKLMEAME